MAGILQCLRMAFESYRSFYPPEAFTDTTLNEEKLCNRFREMSVFVAVRSCLGQEDIVGTISYRLVDDKEAHIRGMGLKPDFAGSGVGKQLLQFVEIEAKKHGSTKLSLDTTAPLTRAITFYVRNGFRASGTVGNYFGLELFEYVKDI